MLKLRLKRATYSGSAAHIFVLLPFIIGCSESLTQTEGSDFDLTEFAARFDPGSIIGAPRLVDCTLAEGM